MKSVLKAAVTTVAIAALAVGIYLGGWWLTRDTTDRNARVLQQTYGRQNALVEQILDDIKDAETPGIPPGQRQAIINQICNAAAKLTGTIELPISTTIYITKECTQ
jgi:hypothetical protein